VPGYASRHSAQRAAMSCNCSAGAHRCLRGATKQPHTDHDRNSGRRSSHLFSYLGGSGNDSGAAIAVDTAGGALLTGATSSTDFPATAGPLQGVLHGSRTLFSHTLIRRLSRTRTAWVRMSLTSWRWHRSRNRHRCRSRYAEHLFCRRYYFFGNFQPKMRYKPR